MDNRTYLNMLKSKYNHLSGFFIENNFLIFKGDHSFRIQIPHVILSNLNEELTFALNHDPINIIHTLYLIELLYRNNLSPTEINFIENYTKKFITLDRNYKNIYDISEFERSKLFNELCCVRYPIELSYLNNIPQNQASQIIKKIIDKEFMEDSKGKKKYPSLVLKKNDNPIFEMEEQMDRFNNIEKAGFATIILIAGTIIATCVYLVYFFSK